MRKFSPKLSLLTLEAVQAERARRSLAYFSRCAWPVIEPDRKLEWSWHIEAVCQHLECCIPIERRRPVQGPETIEEFFQRLLVNIPPGHMKSILMNVMFPAWVWTYWPEWRAVFASYALQLTLRDAIRMRDVVTSEWYQSAFRPSWELREDQNAKGLFANTRGGVRQCISVGSGTTGFRGDFVGVDDPLNATEAASETMRLGAIEWLDKASSSRLNDPRTGSRAMIMQRLHEEDPSGHVLRAGGWIHLCLPSEFEPERKCITPIFEDPRSERGDLLFPTFYTREVLEQAKKDLGSAAYAGQHGQNPAPAGGLIFKAHWWKFWQYPGQNLPPVPVILDDGRRVLCPVETLPTNFDEVLQSWDCTFKLGPEVDFVAGGVWARVQSRAYLLDLLNERLSFTGTVAAIRRMSGAWPQALLKLVEDKANGPAIIDTLTREIPGLVAVEPHGTKEGRAAAVTPVVESGNVYLPHPSLFSWVDPALQQFNSFPKAKHDDIVDQGTQALKRLLVDRSSSMPSGSRSTTDVDISQYTPR